MKGRAVGGAELGNEENAELEKWGVYGGVLFLVADKKSSEGKLFSEWLNVKIDGGDWLDRDKLTKRSLLFSRSKLVNPTISNSSASWNSAFKEKIINERPHVLVEQIAKMHAAFQIFLFEHYLT